MPDVVVDTNVVSYIFKKDTRASSYRRHLIGQSLVVSFMTVAELRAWGLGHNWGQARRDRMEHHLQAYQVYYADDGLCGLWADVCHHANRRGRPIGESDAWIAATALALGVRLVTHNPDDFAGVAGLQILSEA